MALKGNLRDFSITQLLNLINLAHKTGTLIIESANDTARIAFREGKLAQAQFIREDNSLAAVLQRNNKISGAQYKIIRDRGNQMSDKELGLLLMNAGYVSQEDILISLQQYCTEIIKRLFTWAEGLFQFDVEALPPDGKILIRMDLENLIMEGSRQAREMEHLQEEIPTLDMALKFTDRPGTNMKNINLSVEEWRVVSFINPKNSIQQIARATKMDEVEIRRVVYGLLQAGMVELTRPQGMPAPMVPNRAFPPNTNKDEQKNLLNRIIGRIRSI